MDRAGESTHTNTPPQHETPTEVGKEDTGLLHSDPVWWDLKDVLKCKHLNGIIEYCAV